MRRCRKKHTNASEIFWFEGDKLALRKKFTRRTRVPTTCLVSDLQVCDCHALMASSFDPKNQTDLVPTYDWFLKKDQVLTTSVAIMCASNAAFILTAHL